jgi:hypothetical protein
VRTSFRLAFSIIPDISREGGLILLQTSWGISLFLKILKQIFIFDELGKSDYLFAPTAYRKDRRHRLAQVPGLSTSLKAGIDKRLAIVILSI